MTGPLDIPEIACPSLDCITGELAWRAISGRGLCCAALRWTPSPGLLRWTCAVRNALEQTAGHAGHLTASGPLAWPLRLLPSTRRRMDAEQGFRRSGPLAAQGEWSLTASPKGGTAVRSTRRKRCRCADPNWTLRRRAPSSQRMGWGPAFRCAMVRTAGVHRRTVDSQGGVWPTHRRIRPALHEAFLRISPR